jgi:hypothetical protein
VEQSRSPAHFREGQISLDKAHRFRRPETAEVHGSEQTHEAPTTSTPVATHVGDGRQEIPGLLRVGHNAGVDLVGHLRFLPADSRDGVLAQLPQVDRIVGSVDERPPLTPHGFSGCGRTVELEF